MPRFKGISHAWLPRFIVLLTIIALIACGASSPEAPAPVLSDPAQPPAEVAATATPPAPTISAEVGQGAIGAVPTPVPTAVPQAAPQEPVAESKISLLKVARGVANNSSIDPAVGGRGNFGWLEPMYEGLIHFDQLTDLRPMIATEWSANDDFSVWTLQLREGVSFHKGWGEVTAADVVHSLAQGQRLDAQGNRAPATRALLNRIETPEGPDGHQIVLHLNEPEPIMLSWLSTNQNEATIRSKAVWDKAGGELVDHVPNEAGIQEMQNNPIGTGPYQFVEFVEDQHILYAPLDYEHWRITPDFPELQIFFVREASTHLAMLVAEEVHAADVPRDLQVGAESRGMRVISSTTPALRLLGFFGGLHLPDDPAYDSTAPLSNPKVREAMNRAIDREEINRTFLSGRGELMVQSVAHPKFPGWDQSLVDVFDDRYGYDPERAKALLAEAGYPEGFEMTQMSYPRPGLPEILDMGELVNKYWAEIGIKAKFEPVESAKVSNLVAAKETTNLVYLHTGSYSEPTYAIFGYHNSESRRPRFLDPYIEEKYQSLQSAVTLEQRSAVIRDVIRFCFDVYCTIPLFWVPAEFMVNPEVIADWKTPATFGVRNFEYVEAVR
jgi:peptide/nickel transport system substrate-binding protein